MNTSLSHACDIIINGRATAAADDPTQPVIIPNSMPPLIKKRWAQAVRINTRADWRQMAQLCGAYALNYFRDNDYDPRAADFKSACKLAHIAHLRSVQCLTEGMSVPQRFEALA